MRHWWNWVQERATAIVIVAMALALAAIGAPFAFDWMWNITVVHLPTSGGPVEQHAFDLDGTKFEFVELSAGTYSMGSNAGYSDDELPVHRVTMSRIAVSSTEIGAGQWSVVTGDALSGEAGKPKAGLSWCRSIRFANQLSIRMELEPVYGNAENCEASGGLVEWDKRKNGFRLLTESEWEYVARAGSNSDYFFGADLALLSRYSYCGTGALGSATGIEPNEWGFYGTLGGVHEWVWDWYGKYPRWHQADPLGSARTRTRVARGGSFVASSPTDCRSSERNAESVTLANDRSGSRLAVSIEGLREAIQKRNE